MPLRPAPIEQISCQTDNSRRRSGGRIASARLGSAHTAFFHHWGGISAHALERHAWTHRAIPLAGCDRLQQAARMTGRRSLSRAIVFGFGLVALDLIGGS